MCLKLLNDRIYLWETNKRWEGGLPAAYNSKNIYDNEMKFGGVVSRELWTN